MDQKPVIIYCYDAYCGWCFGFSKVIKRLFEEYKELFRYTTAASLNLNQTQFC